MKITPSRGSHLPVLMKVVQMTQGPILELGCGLYSTTFLHWMCYPTQRKLVTCENNPEYFGFLKDHKTDFHEVHCINDWDDIDISRPWSMAFVDHSPDRRRWKELEKLTHADYVVIHDTENQNMKKQGLDKVFKLFKYRWKFDEVYPNTSIWSNKFDVTQFTLRG
jgi:predicted O-methyltransferase YrrM